MGDIWGRIELGPMCGATAFICGIGAGFGARFAKPNWPEPPTEADMEASVEILANFYIGLGKKKELMVDIRARNLGLSPIAYACGAEEGTVDMLKALPTFERFNLVFATNEGQG